MPTIREITSELSEKEKKNILTLVNENAETISSYVMKKDSLFYDYISIREQLKTLEYLNRIVDDEPKKIHLIAAEDSGNIVGYLLYNKDATCNKDVQICSTVVSEKYRRQGVFTDMINLLKSKADSITLSCFINRVNFYKKFGFKIDDSANTQVGMCYGTYTGEGEFWTVDDNDIAHHQLALTEIGKLQQKLGSARFNKENEKSNNENKKEVLKVQKYVKNNK